MTIIILRKNEKFHYMKSDAFGWSIDFRTALKLTKTTAVLKPIVCYMSINSYSNNSNQIVDI